MRVCVVGAGWIRSVSRYWRSFTSGVIARALWHSTTPSLYPITPHHAAVTWPADLPTPDVLVSVHHGSDASSVAFKLLSDAAVRGDVATVSLLDGDVSGAAQRVVDCVRRLL